MYRSHWDIEVYAKDFQDRRWREAAQRRRAEEAVGSRSAGAVGVNPFNLAVARFLSAWSARFASGRATDAPRPVADREGFGKSDVVPQPVREPRGRLAQPYADMVVVARGPMVGVTEQPCGVSDC